MAKVIIAIHGLGNKPPKEQLEAWWKKSILEGLKIIKRNIDLPEFKLIYWADVMYESPLDINVIDKNDPLFLDEKYTPASKNIIPIAHPVRKKVLDFIEEQIDRIFLNDDLTVNFTAITDKIVHNYFHELEVYYSEDCVDVNNISCHARQTIQKRLADVLEEHKDDEIMLISHSMGSIIAFDVLTFVLPEIEIDTFITIGSPLGMPVIMSKIAYFRKGNKGIGADKLKTPPGVKWRWYNFSDLDDKVALIHRLAKKYGRSRKGVKPQDFIVYNNYHLNGIKNHHKSYGYLRTPELSRVIGRFTKKRRIRRFDLIILRMKAFIRKVKIRIMYSLKYHK